MLRKLLSHAAIYGLAAQLPRVAGVLALPLITPHLTTTDYGVAGVVTAYVMALGAVQSLGLSVVLVNAFVKHPTRYKWVWRQVGGFMAGWSVVFGAILAGILYVGIPEEASGNRLLITALACLPLILFTGTELQTNLFYQLSQRPFAVALRSFIVGGIGVALNIYTIAFLRMGYMGWFYSGFVAAVAGFVLNFYGLYFKEKLWPVFRLKRARVKGWLRVSLPVVPHQVSFYMLDTSDKLLLNWLGVPIGRIGLYNVASSFGSYFMAASGAVVQASAPFYLRLYARETSLEAAQQVRRITFALQSIFLVVTTLACLWMREIFEMLIRNEELQKAYPLAIIILMAHNFRPMYLAVVNLLTYRELTGKLWRISTIAVLLNIVLNILLVPMFGYKAAAFTTFAALMYMGYAGYFLKDFKNSTPLNYYPLLWFILTVAALLLVYGFSDISIGFKTIATAVLAGVATAGALLLPKKALQIS